MLPSYVLLVLQINTVVEPILQQLLHGTEWIIESSRSFLFSFP